MNSDSSLVIFKAISNFAKDLAGEFAEKQHSLKLYSHLIEKTTLSHDKAINKHISAFKSFCVSNIDCISEKDYTNLKETTISYSEKAFIDMTEIFSFADKDTEEIIWKHLLFISALIDPTTKVKEMLKKEHTNENDFLNNIISKVENEVEGKENPMEAITSLMQSGIFTNIVSDLNNGIKNGDIDLPKMMGSVQNMVGQMNSGNTTDGTPDMNAMMSQMMTALAPMAGALGNIGPEGSPPPDLQNMMKMLQNNKE